MKLSESRLLQFVLYLLGYLIASVLLFGVIYIYKALDSFLMPVTKQSLYIQSLIISQIVLLPLIILAYKKKVQKETHILVKQTVFLLILVVLIWFLGVAL